MKSYDTPTQPNAVTDQAKRYIFVCAGCGLLSESARKDVMTCSGACRVKAHRNGSIKALQQTINTHRLDVTVVDILQTKAALALMPELEQRINNEGIGLDDVREDIALAFDRLVLQHVQAGLA